MKFIFTVFFLGLLFAACYPEGGCPDSIAACHSTCKENGGMKSYNKDGCICSDNYNRNYFDGEMK